MASRADSPAAGRIATPAAGVRPRRAGGGRRGAPHRLGVLGRLALRRHPIGARGLARRLVAGPRGPPPGGGRAARRVQLALQHREALHVGAVHVLGDLLQRAHRLLARLALPEARDREVEQLYGRREPVERAGAEDAPRLEQRQHRHQMSLDDEPAQRQRALHRRREAEQAAVVGRAVGELDEAGARQEALPHLRRQVLEARVGRRARQLRARRRHALAQQLGPRVVGEERQQGAAIDLRQRLAQGEQRRVQIGRGTERVGQ